MKLKIMGLMFLLMISSVFALKAEVTCLNSTTLYEEIKVFHYIGGSLDSTEIWNHTTPCPYGCSDNMCQEASILNTTMFSVFIGSSLVLMLIAAISGNDAFGLIGALIIMLIGVYLVTQGIVVNDILHKNTLTRMISLALIGIGLYTMYVFGASQFGKSDENEG